MERKKDIIMETLCTIICIDCDNSLGSVETSVPLKEAIERAERIIQPGNSVRVYAETNNGATLTLIYQPK